MLELSELRFVPCHLPPHRQTPAAAAQDRLEMLHLALKQCPGLIADDIELRRDGPSYTVDTLISLRQELGEEAALCLLIGSDAINRLDGWKDWRRLLELAHLVGVDRPGVDFAPPPAVNELLADHAVSESLSLRDKPAGYFLRCRFTLLDISATAIRAYSQAGQSLRFLLPEPVIDYIARKGLYRNRSES